MSDAFLSEEEPELIGRVIDTELGEEGLVIHGVLTQKGLKTITDMTRARVYDWSFEDTDEYCTADMQIRALAMFIMEEVPGEPSQSEGAVDTAIRVIRNLLAENQTLRAHQKENG